MNNFLLINSYSDDLSVFNGLWEELSLSGYKFFLWEKFDIKNLSGFFCDKGWFYKKIFLLPSNKIAFWFLFFPIFIYCFFVFGWLIKKYQLKGVILFGQKEKIIFTFLAKIWKRRIFWIEPPENILSDDSEKLTGIIIKKIFIWARVVVFNQLSVDFWLKLNKKNQNIHFIPLGLKNKDIVFQENIFNSLAREGEIRKKFFTIGSIINKTTQPKIESLFQAVKICQTVIPRLQLVLIGAEEDNKNLFWLVKKMGIDKSVWFVRSDNQLRKWLESFDILIITTPIPKFFDYVNALKFQSLGRPVIAPVDKGMENVLSDGQTGFLVDIEKSEDLAQIIIKAEQNKYLWEKMGKLAKEMIIKHFTVQNMAEEFKKIL